MDDVRELMRQVEELEPRVERLKSLYQQYFMGIEKIPPMVLKKDVDRTIWRLRKMRTNNTRLRFKLQQVVQRYNTYQQYWQRIMREIEKGTYRRHVMRAAQRFGETEVLTIAGRRAQEAFKRMSSAPPPPDEPEQQVWELPDELDGAVLMGNMRAANPAETWEDDAPTPPSNRYKVPEGVKPKMGDPAPPEDEPVRPAPAARRAPHVAHEVGGSAAPSASSKPPRSTPPKTKAKPRPKAKAKGKGALPGARRGALPGAKRKKAAPRPPAEDAAPPPKAPPPKAAGERKREIFDEYLQARKAAGQSTKGITYEKMAKSLESQTKRIKKKHGPGKKVDYEVVTKDGKTMIRPVIK